MSVLLDTHVWIWWVTPGTRLSPRERDALDRLGARGELALSAISLWEAQLLYARARLDLPMSFGDWLRIAAGPESVSVLPLDIDVVLALHALPATFHRDPADRLIVATALAHGLRLATRDAGIRRSRIVKLWQARPRAKRAARTRA